MPIANISSFADFAHASVETTASLLETRQGRDRGAGDVTWRQTLAVRLHVARIGGALTFAARAPGACSLAARAAATAQPPGFRRCRSLIRQMPTSGCGQRA